MTAQQQKDLEQILSRARRDKKGDYRIYSSYKRLIEDLMLSSKEYEQAIRALAKKLRV